MARLTGNGELTITCRNRHCPKCQEDRAQNWLERLLSRLLPCDHYLITFTLPCQLRPVARSHQQQVYPMLLREAAASVQTLAHDRSWVGGTPGILAVLHTWSRTLRYHPHVHLLVTAGGLSADGTAWVKLARPRFLMPAYALSEIFRAKMHHALARAGLNRHIDPKTWIRPWTLQIQQVGRGGHAARYLSRYVYRVALTNHRLERFEHGHVTFRYTHSRTRHTRHLTLPVDVFIARFLQHVLPRGFTKIRSYGLMSPSRRNDLERARRLLQLHSASTGHPVPSGALLRGTADRESDASDAKPGSVTTTTIPVANPSVLRCRVCHGTSMRLVHRYRPSRAPPW